MQCGKIDFLEQFSAYLAANPKWCFLYCTFKPCWICDISNTPSKCHCKEVFQFLSFLLHQFLVFNIVSVRFLLHSKNSANTGSALTLQFGLIFPNHNCCQLINQDHMWQEQECGSFTAIKSELLVCLFNVMFLVLLFLTLCYLNLLKFDTSCCFLFLDLPSSGITNACTAKKSLQYLVPWSSQCLQKTPTTKEECNSVGSHLYYQISTIIRSPLLVNHTELLSGKVVSSS